MPSNTVICEVICELGFLKEREFKSVVKNTLGHFECSAKVEHFECV